MQTKKCKLPLWQRFPVNPVTFLTIAAFFLACISLIPASKASAAQTTLSWSAPSTYADGTAMTVNGYKVYQGTAKGSYTQSVDVGNQTSYTLANLVNGSTYYFAVTAYDGAKTESAYSNEMSKSFGATYSITATSGPGGSINFPSGVSVSTATSGSSVIKTASVPQGGSLSLSVAPASGYAISGVTVDGASVGAVSSYTFSNVIANHTVSATFASTTTSTTTTTPTGHWDDITTGTSAYQDATPSYMEFSPMTADTTGKVTALRVRIYQYGAPTAIRLALYSAGGAKLTEGTMTVAAAGYATVSVPAAYVTQGATYYIAAQAASSMLYRFACGSTTGGYEAPNSYGSGLPAALPSGRWGGKLLNASMYIQ
ncbi:fibronectin type III domain-containing protein [Geomonas ferrireducens]|uniref:fibronectin type III domain-containing protein n=1 Tax=Geomonas ferrireducens TaxID=2570227 RepID=UPI0013A5D192|nr:fibronectin type III domain-containing protein [Geomonas ferrireducens]